MSEFSDAELALLYKFAVQLNAWGQNRRHIHEDNLAKGFPAHVKGEIKKAAELLRKKGLLYKWPTNHGCQWGANLSKREVIFKLLESYSEVDGVSLCKRRPLNGLKKG